MTTAQLMHSEDTWKQVHMMQARTLLCAMFRQISLWSFFSYTMNWTGCFPLMYNACFIMNHGKIHWHNAISYIFWKTNRCEFQKPENLLKLLLVVLLRHFCCVMISSQADNYESFEGCDSFVQLRLLHTTLSVLFYVLVLRLSPLLLVLLLSFYLWWGTCINIWNMEKNDSRIDAVRK